MNRKSLVQTLLWILLFVVALIGAIWVWMRFTDNSFGEIASAYQAIITSFAIVVAAAFAIFKLEIFRDLAPHLTISQEVSHRQIGDSYIHVNVAATLQNNSKVKVELQEGFFLIQQIAPVNDEEIEALYAEVFIDQESEYILWPILDKAPRAWDRGTLIIEPGESHQEICEFLVSSSVKSVLIYSYFFNCYSKTPRGWHSTTIHDIT